MSATPLTARTSPSAGVSGKRTRWLILLAILAGWVVYDLVVPPAQALDAWVAVAAIDRYRAHISPHLHGVVVCRFHPTCSFYGRAAIARRGFLAGGFRTAIRLARCGPWTPEHTEDPP